MKPTRESILRAQTALDSSRKNENAIAPLISAVYGGDAEIVEALLSLGVDINAPDGHRQTALMKAANCRNHRIVETLIENGADVNAGDENGRTALIMGTGGDRDDIVRTLLRGGADVNAKTDAGVTALMSASFYGNAAATSLLLENGADVDARGADGETALILAGNANAARLLIDSGADPNACRHDGRTALMEAALAVDCDTVKVLLACGAEAGVRDGGGVTPMMWAIRQEDRRTGLELQNDMTWKLLKTRCGLYREQPVVMARREAGLKEILKMLLASGTDVNARDSDGWTALKLAKVRMKRSIAKLLTGAGAVLSPEDVIGLDFLSAVKNDNVRKVRTLLGKGADVDTVNHKGVTGLGIAAYWNRVDIARLLLEMGADPGAEDDDGQTPLELAGRRGNAEIVELINEQGESEPSGI